MQKLIFEQPVRPEAKDAIFIESEKPVSKPFFEVLKDCTVSGGEYIQLDRNVKAAVTYNFDILEDWDLFSLFFVSNSRV